MRSGSRTRQGKLDLLIRVYKRYMYMYMYNTCTCTFVHVHVHVYVAHYIGSFIASFYDKKELCV